MHIRKEKVARIRTMLISQVSATDVKHETNIQCCMSNIKGQLPLLSPFKGFLQQKYWNHSINLAFRTHPHVSKAFILH